VVADLPPEKQRMLERLHSSDDDLVGQTVLLVDDDARNIFALSSVLERRGMRVLTATTGSEAITAIESRPDVAIVLNGHHDAGHGRLRDHPGHPRQPAFRRLPIVALTAKAMKRRPREVSGGRCIGLPRQARQHRAASLRAADVAASLMRRGRRR